MGNAVHAADRQTDFHLEVLLGAENFGAGFEHLLLDRVILYEFGIFKMLKLQV